MYFNKLFWGFLFFFDFRIQGFDILPDIVGYCIIYSALNGLALLNGHFKRAKKYVLPLIILSFSNIYQVQQQVTQFKVNTIGIVLIVVSAITSIMHLLMAFHICMGISEMAQDINNNELQETAKRRWKHYLIVQALTMAFIFTTYFIHTLVTIIFMPLFVVSIIVLLLIIGLMKQAEENFEKKTI